MKKFKEDNIVYAGQSSLRFGRIRPVKAIFSDLRSCFSFGKNIQMNLSTSTSSLRRSKQTMYPLIEQYLSKGESQADFCALHQIKVCTFQYWLGKYRSESRRGPVLDSGFVPLEVVAAPEGDYALELRDASGRHLCFRKLPPVKYLKALLC
jgi:hypothetical protein